MKTLARLILGLVIFDAAVTAPTLEPINYDSENYDTTLEDLDNLYNYESIPIVGQAEIEMVTMMPSGNRELLTPPPQPEEAEEEEEESTPRLIDGSSPQEPEFPGVLGPHTNEDFPTCLLCTCISTTVYCDDHELDAIPPLPKNTAYFYSRFNKIKKINKNDLSGLNDLRRIDLTSNLISEIDEDAFRKLPQLRELVLRDNKIRQLPELPSTLTFIDISNNRLGRKGIKQEAFKVSLKVECERFSSWSMTSLFYSRKEFILMRLLTTKTIFTILFITLLENTMFWYILRLVKHQEQKAKLK
uniref:Epiphycan n=1 Tax=Rousettus aegyptiacus TaxID=9407 RepID=A0A7J8JDX5_ROUAE|nr:epiphycan [Rousettus aegyptiacus]